MPWLRAIQSGFIITFPLMFVGSIAVLINQFPLPAYRAFMTDFFGPHWTYLGEGIWNGTFAVMSIAVSFSAGMNLAEKYNEKFQTRQVNPITVGIISFSSLFCLIVPVNGGIPQSWTGVAGLFAAILVSLVSSYLFFALSSIRHLRMRFFVDNAGGSVVQTFSSLVPGSLVIAFFGMLGLVLGMRTGSDFHAIFHHLLGLCFESLDSEFLRGVLYTLSIQILWFFGIHGANVLDPVTHGIYNGAIMDNAAAFAAGTPLPHIVTKPFLDCFVFIGGTGCTFSLILALLIFSRFSEYRRLSGISSFFGVFNINELLVFGFPLILNPVMLIPFVFIPAVLCLVSYGVVAMDLVPRTSTSAGWSVPVFVNAFMVTGSFKAVVLQAVNIVIGTLIYAPFVRIADAMRRQDLKNAVDSLFECVNDNSLDTRQKRCLNRTGAVGAIARGLAGELEAAVRKNDRKSGLHLLYQPQVAPLSNAVVGVEALLRWNHPKLGYISPMIVVALAEDADIVQELGDWILNEACATRRKWLDMGIVGVSMSVNVSVYQIDRSLPKRVEKALSTYGLSPDMLKLEVTESISLDAAADGPAILEEIHASGVRISIDDFGMGHSSLAYLRKFPVSSVKIDGSITREVTTSALSADIVSSIVGLCQSRGIDCIVEYVETKEEIQILLDLNCTVFQGYYYSKPLPDAQCSGYIREFGKEKTP